MTNQGIHRLVEQMTPEECVVILKLPRGMTSSNLPGIGRIGAVPIDPTDQPKPWMVVDGPSGMRRIGPE